MNTEHVAPRSLIRLQSWLSPAFPTGSYSYSHGLESAVESKQIHDRQSLVDWLDADLRYGSARNDAIFFVEAWRCAASGHHAQLLEIAELAAAFRGTSEFALEASQQGTLLSRDAARGLARFGDRLAFGRSSGCGESSRSCPLCSPSGRRRKGFPLGVAVRAFLHGFVGNLVTAGVRLIPLGQTDGQRAIAELEDAVLDASERAMTATHRRSGVRCADGRSGVDVA